MSTQAFISKFSQMSHHHGSAGKKVLLGGMLGLLSLSVSAQQTQVHTEIHRSIKQADVHYQSGLYSQAYESYDQAVTLLLPVQSASYDLLEKHAVVQRAKSALQMGHPQGEQMMLDIAKSYAPDPVSTEATTSLADYYYQSGNYESAAKAYAQLKSAGLSQEMLSEARFKQGYSHFVRKEYREAQVVLSEVRELKTPYFYPVNYYYGMCMFIDADYAAALKAFERVEKSEKYAPYIPYQIAQIHFALKDYAKVISYAEPRLAHAGVKNKLEMRSLVGRAYFESGDFNRALPHLEAFAKEAASLRAEDFYQLGYAQYKAGRYADASQNFKQVASDTTALGQRANFFLADCALRTGDLHGARTAFRNVSRMEADPALREEALLQYGKLSAQLHAETDAIEALSAIPASSPNAREAQEVLRDVFFHSRDFVNTLAALEKLPSLSPTLKESYQQVSLFYGMQLMQDGKDSEAIRAFEQVEKYPVKATYTAQSLFWRAEIAHRQARYAQSADLLRKYFTLSKTITDLPAEASTSIANYLQGYNYLKMDNHIAAQGHFAECITSLKTSSSALSRNVLPDAYVRTGDCALRRNQYAEAKKMYDAAIDLGGSVLVYAKFQRAIIDGLENRPEAKIASLEQIIARYPDSDLADDAYLHAALTYQESGKNDQSVESLQHLLEKYPHSDLRVTALLRLGLVYYNSGNAQAALKEYKKVFNSNPTPAEAREAMSAVEEIYVQDLKTPEAYFSFVSTIPGYELSAFRKDSVTYRVAEIHYEQAEYSKAVTAFTDYLKKYPKGMSATSAYFFRGDAYAIQKMYTEALGDFEKVVAAGNGTYYQDALNRSAVLSYHHVQDFRKANTYYTQLHKIVTDPKLRFEAQIGLMRSAFRTGDPEATLEWAESVASHVLSDANIRSEAAYYQAKAALELGEHSLALEQFGLVAQNGQNEQSAEARYHIAALLFRSGNIVAAEEAAMKATQENSNYPFWVAKSLILLSDIALQRKDYFNAKAPLEAVIENFDGDAQLVREAQQKLAEIQVREQADSRLNSDTSRVLPLEILDADQKED